ncbi:MAG: adenylate/guanylate cyclase domain-containing protein, partial [Gemmatimonadota bacterium]
MSEQGIRRLAAIMFADMVGYTALMQEDEAAARARRDRHRAVLSDLVPRHRGEILQHYGDGTLSVFQSAVEAVECAVAIQAALQQPPEVALRIGVHSGDIVRDEDGVYGDGVNVAARIESLSATGGVLVSGKVYDEIKNHPSLSTTFLGEVGLKNVKQPVKVYAITNPGLAVPSAEDIGAKTDTGLVPVSTGRDVTPVEPLGPGELFLQRARDRAILPWAIAYLAGAWASLEIVGFLTQLYGWSLIVHRSFAVLAFAGFFVTLVVAWFHGERGRQRVRGSEVLIIAVVLLTAGGAITLLRRNAAQQRPGRAAIAPAIEDNRPSVAVLPFENLSAEAENAYFASGLHDEVITQLLRVSGLRVISRTSVMEYATTRPNVRVIGQELGVSHVTEATVQRIGDRLRVNVQLIDANTDDHLWAMSWDRELNDAFAVQSEVARVIADSLTTTLTAEERGAISKPPTENPEAYRFYLQGRDYYLRPGYRQENYLAAEGLFERAIELDPDFALAHAMLSRVHGHMYWESFDASAERLGKQQAEADEALRLQPELPQAHVSAGWLHYVRGEFGQALTEYETALRGLP